jgi:hypothetical protein
VNELQQSQNPLPEPEGTNDFCVIETFYDSFAVSRQVADAVARQLGQRQIPRWIIFRDLSMAFHRILAAHVYRFSESTVATRAASRAFWRARRLEDKKDRRPWEDDD